VISNFHSPNLGKGIAYFLVTVVYRMKNLKFIIFLLRENIKSELPYNLFT